MDMYKFLDVRNTIATNMWYFYADFIIPFIYNITYILRIECFRHAPSAEAAFTITKTPTTNKKEETTKPKHFRYISWDMPWPTIRE